MPRLTKLFSVQQAPAPDTRNHEGFPAYIPSEEEAVAELLYLGTLGHTFYASGAEWTTTFTAMLKKAVDQNPQFVARAAVRAREDGLVRSTPLVAVMALVSGGPHAQSLGRRIFPRIVRTADDLRNFVALAQSGQFRTGYGGLPRRLAAVWLNERLDEYQAVKYAASGDRLSLRNILRLTHPTPPSAERDAIYRWLVKGTLTPGVSLPLMASLKSLIHSDIDPVSAITQGRLPFEAVMPRVSAGDRSIWEALLPNAPYMFLLRSLKAFGRAGVWENPDALETAMRILKDPNRVRKAMQFPFRYYQAAQVLAEQNAPQGLINAVYEALELALGNLPAMEAQHIAIAPDVSGSMTNTLVAQNVSAAHIAGIFTGALWKRNPNARILPFGTDVHPVRAVSPRDSIMAIAHSIGTIQGGGTDLSSPIRSLLVKRQVIDLFIGLTDSEDWAASGGWQGQGFLSAWFEYRKVAPKAQAILVQLVPGQTRVAPRAYPSVHYVYGWSDAILRYVAHIARGRTLVDHIQQTAI